MIRRGQCRLFINFSNPNQFVGNTLYIVYKCGPLFGNVKIDELDIISHNTRYIWAKFTEAPYTMIKIDVNSEDSHNYFLSLEEAEKFKLQLLEEIKLETMETHG